MATDLFVAPDEEWSMRDFRDADVYGAHVTQGREGQGL